METYTDILTPYLRINHKQPEKKEMLLISSVALVPFIRIQSMQYLSRYECMLNALN